MRSIGNGSKDQPNHFQSSVVLSILGRLHFPVFEIYKSFQRDLYFIKYSWPCFERISNAVHWNAGGAGWKLRGGKRAPPAKEWGDVSRLRPRPEPFEERFWIPNLFPWGKGLALLRTNFQCGALERRRGRVETERGKEGPSGERVEGCFAAAAATRTF